MRGGVRGDASVVVGVQLVEFLGKSIGEGGIARLDVVAMKAGRHGGAGS